MSVSPDESSPDAAYVDLLLNPERYTGYQGPSAWRVWNSIYEENCFKYDNILYTMYTICTPDPVTWVIVYTIYDLLDCSTVHRRVG